MVSQEILDFLKDDNQFLIIDGPAGTGKTTLISNLIVEAKKLGLNVVHQEVTKPAGADIRLIFQH